MKIISTVISFDRYADENDIPICGDCDFSPDTLCEEARLIQATGRWEPGPSCRVWYPEAPKPTDQCCECDWHPVAGLGGWCYMFRDKPTEVCMKFKPRGK